MLCLPLLSMKAAGGEWALLSPEGTYHKLSEPNFFVGREDEMDLTLKVGLRWISFAAIDLEFYVIKSLLTRFLQCCTIESRSNIELIALWYACEISSFFLLGNIL